MGEDKIDQDDLFCRWVNSSVLKYYLAGSGEALIKWCFQNRRGQKARAGIKERTCAFLKMP